MSPPPVSPTQLASPSTESAEPVSPAFEPAVLTIRETARYLRIGRRQAYEAAARGELPGVIKIGRRILVSRAALDAMLSGGA